MDLSKKKSLLSAMLVSLLVFCFCLTSCGPSAAEMAIRSAPSVEAVKGLKDKFIWLQGNVQSGGSYVLEIDSDEIVNCGFLSSCFELSYKDKSNVTITLRGIGENRTIGFVMHSTNGAGKAVYHRGFSVKSGVTLVLDDNITLKGGTQEFAFVQVGNGGTLVMNDGSVITGAINNNNDPGVRRIYGGGVIVYNGGTFIMKGGTISGNTIYPRTLTAQEIQTAKAGYALGRSLVEGGKKAANAAEEKMNEVATPVGGGVYVSGGVVKRENSSPFDSKPAPSGTFIKTGGTITGYSSDPENGNVIKDVEGKALNGFGHAVFFDTPAYSTKDKEPKAIDTTVGPEITLHFSNGILREGKTDKSEGATVQADE